MPYNGDIVYCGMEDAVAAHPLHPLALLPGPGGPGAPALAPVEYTLAVDRYLGQAVLGEASRRVYRISLSGWAWPLVGRTVPRGTARRGAVPPLVPLALLDDPTTPGRLAAALAERAAGTDFRTAEDNIGGFEPLYLAPLIAYYTVMDRSSTRVRAVISVLLLAGIAREQPGPADPGRGPRRLPHRPGGADQYRPALRGGPGGGDPPLRTRVRHRLGDRHWSGPDSASSSKEPTGSPWSPRRPTGPKPSAPPPSTSPT
jgi:hypothetical protein